MKKTWFKRKQYGWGWTPASWEGWIVMLAYVAGVLYFFRNADAQALPFIMLTAALIIICFVKGEAPKWQWGNRDSDTV